MKIKERIETLLLSTKREGMYGLLSWMDENGFYESPCSGGNHLAKEGGLAEHSLNVFDLMFSIRNEGVLGNNFKMPTDSIVLCGLLHDLGKCGDYGKSGYVPNMVKDGRPTKAEPEQKYKQSESKPFKVNDELTPVDHEIRSIKIASKFIELTEEEELAILWHNGLYGNFRYQIQGKETSLYMLLHFADMWASRVVEKAESGIE
ncbi:HD family phosphohydrolase [Lachnospiraceae bacterium]|nr:HD family phosphohydrolase [Lachnospiraceae bacterium]